MSKSITLLRHAHTEHNGPPKKFQGRLDVSISDKGIKQCIAKQNEFHWVDSIIASPAIRVQETLNNLFSERTSKPDIHFDDDLWEIDNGWFSGKYEHEVNTISPEQYRMWCEQPEKARPGGGETLQEMSMRAKRAFQRIETSYANKKNLLVATHGGIIRISLLLSQGRSLNEFHSLNVPNLSTVEIPLNDILYRKRLNY